MFCGQEKKMQRKRRQRFYHFTLSFRNQFSYDVRAHVSFTACCRMICERPKDTLSYYFAFSAWINLFIAFPHFSAYAAANLNIQSRSGAITSVECVSRFQSSNNDEMKKLSIQSMCDVVSSKHELLTSISYCGTKKSRKFQ